MTSIAEILPFVKAQGYLICNQEVAGSIPVRSVISVWRFAVQEGKLTATCSPIIFLPAGPPRQKSRERL
jgi:hypothetical protein